jgi:hypothetical protein
MPNTRSHVHNYYAIEEACSGLVPWLNAKIPRTSDLKVKRLVRLLQEVETASNKNTKLKLISEANRILRRCKFVRHVTEFYLDGVEHLAIWKPTNKPKAELKIKSLFGAEETMSEDEALLSVSQLYIMLSIDRLRQCKHCRNWLCARFPHQRFCSARCRERHFQSSPEWKEQRRRKAREYYRLHKTTNVK